MTIGASRPKPRQGRAAHDRFIDLREKGCSRDRAAQMMGLGLSTAQHYDRVYLAQMSGYGRDSTVPNFADHDLHLSLLAPYVGFDAVARLMTRRAA